MFLRIIFIALILFSGWMYFRNFEHKNIYFPSAIIEFTPADKGLSFEEVFYRTSDGKKNNGWFVPAQNARGTMLFCHGNGGNIGHRIDFLEIFNKLKLNVFIFDYRGYGKSPGRPSEKGIYLDAKGAYDYLSGRADIDKDKIVLYGESLGGAVVIDLAKKIKASGLIIFGAFTSVGDMGRELYSYLPIKLIITQRYDSRSKIKDLTIPKLIIHSRDDEIVPFSQGERLYAAASFPKEFFEMRDGHNEAALLNSEKFSQKIDAFLLKYVTK